MPLPSLAQIGGVLALIVSLITFRHKLVSGLLVLMQPDLLRFRAAVDEKAVLVQRETIEALVNRIEVLERAMASVLAERAAADVKIANLNTEIARLTFKSEEDKVHIAVLEEERNRLAHQLSDQQEEARRERETLKRQLREVRRRLAQLEGAPKEPDP